MSILKCEGAARPGESPAPEFALGRPTEPALTIANNDVGQVPREIVLASIGELPERWLTVFDVVVA